MAEIYLARVSGAGGFEKNVVVKRILPQLAESDEFFTMFLDEARIAATLQHPNVVDIYDAGQEEGEYFIAMEHLDGADLHTVRRVLGERGEGMPLQHAVFIVTSVAAGLHHAHEKVGLDGRPLRIVHRDVTPQNVFLTRDGGVKLVDFGIAKSANRVSTTTYGTLKGKLAYMAPEQCRAEPVDRRSDIYSLGVMLYELTCGRRPHLGRSEYELLREIVEGQVPPPSAAVPEYPVELEAIAMRALAAHPDERYPHALAMEQDLERFARREGRVGSTLALAEFLAPLLDAAEEQAQTRWRRRVSTAPPIETDTDRQVTVATFVGRRLGRLQSRPPDAEGDAAADAAAAAEYLVDEPSARRARLLADAADADAAVAVDAGVERTADVAGVAGADGEVGPDGDAGPEETLGGTLTDLRLDRRGRPRGVGPLAISLLLAAGGVAASIYYHGPDGRPSEPGEGALLAGFEPAAGPALGVLDVTSDPPGAAVWLNLGSTPVVSGAVERGRGHWIRVEHDGYEARDLPIDAGEAVAVALVPAQGGATPREPEALPVAGRARARSSAARIRVSSQPSAATVWLLVGVTPARIELVAGRPHELRLGRDGYLPAFVVIPPERLGARGVANLSASLLPRPVAPTR